MRHRLSIGAIVSSTTIQVKFTGGKHIGSVEESFISKLKPGDVFSFAGRTVELVRVNGMVAQVKASNKKTRLIPSWAGSKMPLTSQLSRTIRLKLDDYYEKKIKDPEIIKLIPLFEEQQRRSHVPRNNELLIEKVKTKEGHHLFFYPFDGRNAHEGLAALFAYRIAQIIPISFSLAVNDYGFELLSDQEIPLEEAMEKDLFSTKNLFEDISKTVNLTEMARRKFRDIASIAGLVFNGYPGKQVKTRHLQASSQLFFNVFSDYDANNLLLRQAFDEVMIFQMEEIRILDALNRMSEQTIVIKELDGLSPFSFPIFAESLHREKLSNEEFEQKVQKIIKQQLQR
jgi:ATP-dependent Lhr-like helicase